MTGKIIIDFIIPFIIFLIWLSVLLMGFILMMMFVGFEDDQEDEE